MAQESWSDLCFLFRIWKSRAWRTCFLRKWNLVALEPVPPLSPCVLLGFFFFEINYHDHVLLLSYIFIGSCKAVFSSNHPYSLMFTEVESFLQEYRKGPSLLAKGQLLIPEMETVVFSELKWKRTLMSNQWCIPGSAQGQAPIDLPQGPGCREDLCRYCLAPGCFDALEERRETLSKKLPQLER